MRLHRVEPDHFRAVMGHFATGVAVVTAEGADGPVGMTANAACSLSLEPLLLLVCFDDGARTPRVVRATERFGVTELVPGGDHTIGIGAVRSAETGDAGAAPLLWFRGAYADGP